MYLEKRVKRNNMKKLNKIIKRQLRNRKKLKKVSTNRYRISVFKSLKNISAQIIDDKEKKTLVSASSIEKELKAKKKKKIESSTLLGEIYVITFVTSIKLVIDWIKQREIIVKTNKILLENELKYLRSQIQPHFFFNTLNNLYSLTIDKSDKAPNLILKLSDLMKYFLYETGKEFQKLEKEINHIKDYIEIEKLRYDESLSISFVIKGEIKKKKIRPLLLIPLVENAFKHGARSSKLNGYINIDLKVEGDFLNFRVENSMTKINNKLKEQIGGIGLSNIKKRLELNYGEGNFDLKNFEEKNKYIAQLRVKLKT